MLELMSKYEKLRDESVVRSVDLIEKHKKLPKGDPKRVKIAEEYLSERSRVGAYSRALVHLTSVFKWT